MTDATKYLPSVAWRTWIRNVILISEGTYRVTVKPIDVNEPGAAPKNIGNYLKDYIGHTYKIVDSSTDTIDVTDDFQTGVGPQSGRQGVVYQSVKKGNSPYLAPTYYRHLDKSALEYSRIFELDILWKPDPIKIEFSDTATPSILNYQDDYAEIYGEYPKVQLITYDEEGVEWVRQEVPVWNRSEGALTSIVFDLSDRYSGYMVLSK